MGLSASVVHCVDLKCTWGVRMREQRGTRYCVHPSASVRCGVHVDTKRHTLLRRLVLHHFASSSTTSYEDKLGQTEREDASVLRFGVKTDSFPSPSSPLGTARATSAREPFRGAEDAQRIQCG